MKYYIPALETLSSLEMAKELNEIPTHESVVLDARNMTFVKPFGMLYAASTIKRFRNQCPDSTFDFTHCVDDSRVFECISYAGHMGFFKSIDERVSIGKMPGEALGNNNYIPITKIDFIQMHEKEKEKEHPLRIEEAIEQEASRLAKVLSRDNMELHHLFTYLIREVLRNVLEHSESNEAWICGQFWQYPLKAEIAILDNGIGITKSLQKNSTHRQYIDSDEEALKCAIKAGISQTFRPMKTNRSDDEWANSGFGLYVASELCKRLNGGFCLATGSKYIMHLNPVADAYMVQDTCFNGTAVKMEISTANISNSREIINQIVQEGEVQARTIRNAFKNASKPSKGLISDF